MTFFQTDTRVTQGSEQSAPLKIFDRVLNMPLALSFVTESCEFCVNCVLEVHGVLNMAQVLNVARL